MFKIKIKPKKSTIILSFLLLPLIIFFTFFFKKTNLEMGNFFFGDSPNFYNISLAEYFYTKEIEKSKLESMPPPRNTYYQLGRVKFIQGDLYGAIQNFDAEEAQYPDNMRVHYMKGLSFGYMKLEERGIDEFSKFISWKPSSWAARNDKAWLEFRIGDIDAALETISPVTHLTDNAWVQNTYGVLLMNKGRYLEAKLAFANAKAAADKLTETEWGKVYPGNDPRIYTAGINATRKSIESNIELIRLK